MIRATDRNVVYSFFRERLNIHDSLDFRGALYVPDHFNGMPTRMEDVAIGVAYNAFIGRTCCLHGVVQKPEYLTRGVLRETFGFPFNACGCEAVLVTIEANNERSLNLNRKLGFREIHRVPNGGLEGDLVLMQMLRAECRWLPKPH